ncbi:MAG: 4-(cytidine 5'-diphospho)-2-C-methyl-D-erythritol kinase [Eubacteriales bacterium]
MKTTINAAAKINLFLDILALLPNGYHSLFMVMQSVGLYDTIELEQTQGNKITITCSESALPTDESNIAYKAATAFFKAAGLKNKGLHIHIEKRIPYAAGLAGGSADAAAVIAGLNMLFKTALNEKQLCEIGLTVGSDVPFCIMGSTMLVQDVGGVLSSLPTLPPCFIVLAKPESGVSTKGAYKTYDEFSYIHHLDTVNMLSKAASGDLRSICEACGNVFEECIEVPERIEIKSVMRKHGALCSQMSGSGPTVFGIFDNKSNAEACAVDLKKLVKDVYICEPVERGLEIV